MSPWSVSLKFCIGTVDISSRIRDFKRELERRGIGTFTVKRTEDDRYVSNTDEVMSRSRSYYWPGVRPRFVQNYLRQFSEKSPWGIQRRLLDRAIEQCDVFVFLWSSFYKDRSDYSIIKDAGKRVVTCFVGSDVRSTVAAKIEFQSHGIEMPVLGEGLREFKSKIDYIDIAELYSDAIFSRPDQSQLLTRDYYRMLPCVTVSDFKPNTSQRQTPLVVCASSGNPIKGGDVIRQAVEQLRSEKLHFEYKLIRGVSQYEARKWVATADVVIDQMYLPGGGKAAVEAMASGSVCLTRMQLDSYPQLYDQTPPIVDVSPETLAERLRDLIRDVRTRKQLAMEGPVFVEQHANIEHFVESILRSIGPNPSQPDFSPSFLKKAKNLEKLPANYRQVLGKRVAQHRSTQ